MRQRKFILPESEIPRQWYNLRADIKMNPYLKKDGEIMKPEDLAPVFPMNLIEQEFSTERWIDIPEEVLDLYSIWRPVPLVRAYALEKALNTPAKIYYKYEGISPAGSHKPNSAVPQAYYNKVFGTKKVTTETGAGQWGSALSFACEHFGIECKIYMVRVSFNQKPYRKLMMQTWGGNCVSSPSMETNFGRMINEKFPDAPGSLGIAISEAIEEAVSDPTGTTKYTLGSVLNHVTIHQSIIGLEAKRQLELIGDYPDIVIGCAGGGSNFAGIAFPFIHDKINGKDIQIVAVEPSACPTLTRSPFGYDHGDTEGFTPLLPMHSLGKDFMPPAIHAGGLRYHGMAPTVSQTVAEGLTEARSVTQLEAFEAGILTARTEGYIPAPESNHAIAEVIKEAHKAREEGKEKVILFNWTGHGLIDLPSYGKYLDGELTNYDFPQSVIDDAEEMMHKYPKPELYKSR